MAKYKNLFTDKKGVSTLTGIIIIVAVAVVLFGAVFAIQFFAAKQQKLTDTETQKQEILNRKFPIAGDQPAGWQTYRNDEYGFQIDYPVIGSISEDSRGQFVMNLKNNDSKGRKQIWIGIDKYTNCNLDFINRKVFANEVIINGIKFLKADIDGDNSETVSNINQYCTERAGLGYHLTFFLETIPVAGNVSDSEAAAAESTYLYYQNLFQKILNTFKFTK